MDALNKKTIEDIDVKGKKVLARCDFNVPLKDGEIKLFKSYKEGTTYEKIRELEESGRQ